jgi:hypothetical protein
VICSGVEQRLHDGYGIGIPAGSLRFQILRHFLNFFLALRFCPDRGFKENFCVTHLKVFGQLIFRIIKIQRLKGHGHWAFANGT